MKAAIETTDVIEERTTSVSAPEAPVHVTTPAPPADPAPATAGVSQAAPALPPESVASDERVVRITK